VSHPIHCANCDTALEQYGWVNEDRTWFLS
jgi:hypothetical protein